MKDRLIRLLEDESGEEIAEFKASPEVWKLAKIMARKNKSTIDKALLEMFTIGLVDLWAQNNLNEIFGAWRAQILGSANPKIDEIRELIDHAYAQAGLPKPKIYISKGMNHAQRLIKKLELTGRMAEMEQFAGAFDPSETWTNPDRYFWPLSAKSWKSSTSHLYYLVGNRFWDEDWLLPIINPNEHLMPIARLPIVILTDILNQLNLENVDRWEIELTRKIFCWWPGDDRVVVLLRPEVDRDQNGRPHSLKRAAVRWGDGQEQFFVHGIEVTRRVIEQPQTLTPQKILATTNLERRRALIEIYGADRLLLGAKSRLVDQSEKGKLWVLDIPGDEPLIMAEVTNSTAEPDGHYKTYFLRVPPRSGTVQAALAWSFNLPSEDYSPLLET